MTDNDIEIATEPDCSAVEHVDSADVAVPHDSESDVEDSEGDDPTSTQDVRQRKVAPLRTALIVGLLMLSAVAGLTGWLGFRAYQGHEAQHQREVYLRAARQAAINLTTIDYNQVDSDIQRILGSSTGGFYDDFEKRAPAFARVVQQAQSKSEGSITDAGIESTAGASAQVIVALSVKTSNVGAQEQPPRHWRMRITVQRMGDGEAKASDVKFVP